MDFDDLDFRFPNMLSENMKLSLALNQRKILINETISDEVSLEVLYYISKIRTYDNLLGTKDPIEIYIDTNGGDAFAGFAIVDMIEQLKNDGYKVVTINMAKSFSAGMIIAISGSVRKAFSRSRYMLHDVASGAIGKSRELRESLEETEIIRDIYFDIIEKYTTITREDIENWIDRKYDKFFSAKELMELKGVDVIL